MRNFLILLIVFLLALPIFPQEKAGNIYGRVVDPDGNGLPGVLVTLTGSLTAPVTQITTAEGNFRFRSLAPAKDYALKAELQGFTTKIEERIYTNAGQNITLTIVMEISSLQKEVTVTARVPVLDIKRTSTAMSVDREIMQSLPTARDTLSLMALAPGVTPYKAYAGDSNIGMMNNAGARGSEDTFAGVYYIDGAMIEGAYWDMDQWEEVQISIGGADVTRRTGNLTMNMITKRGGNKISFGGRFYVSDSKFQADNLTDALKQEGVLATDRINLNKDYGFNFGGPIVRDKAWFWMAYGVQDTDRLNVVNAREKYLLTTYNAKLNLQLIPQNRLEIWGMVNKKLGEGAGAGPTDFSGTTITSPRHFGMPTWRIGDEHTFGDSLFVSLSTSYTDAGLASVPGNNVTGDLIAEYNAGKGVWTRKARFRSWSRPRNNINFSGNYFNDNLFGLAHEIKAGYTWERVGEKADRRYNVIKNINYLTNTVDITGDGYPDVVPGIARLNFQRWFNDDYGTHVQGAYLSDTLTKGPFNLILGIRYDYGTYFLNENKVLNSVLRDTTAWITDFTPETADAIDKIIPAFTIPGEKPDSHVGFFSPRMGLTWDIGGKNRTIAKLTLSTYPGNGLIVEAWEAGEYFLPLGASAWTDFWWLDNNADGRIDYRELYWNNSGNFAPYRAFNDAGDFVGNWTDTQGNLWDDFDPFNPTQLTRKKIKMDNSLGVERVRETTVSLEHEFLPGIAAFTNLTYCIFDKPNWIIGYWPDTGKIQSKDDYVQIGTLPDHVGPYSTEEASGRPYYLLNGDVTPTSYSIRMQRPDYNRKYYEMSVGLTKRMSNNWMANASFTLSKDVVDFGENGSLNPTNNWAYEGRQWYDKMPRWLFKFSGIYRFPLDFNLALTFFAREGDIINDYVTIVDYDAPNPVDQSIDVQIRKYGDLRLKSVFDASLRLEKAIKMSDTGRIYLTADIFNLANLGIIVLRSARALGTYYMHDGSFVPNPQSFPEEIKSFPPLHVRFGVRFQF